MKKQKNSGGSDTLQYQSNPHSQSLSLLEILPTLNDAFQVPPPPPPTAVSSPPDECHAAVGVVAEGRENAEVEDEGGDEEEVREEESLEEVVAEASVMGEQRSAKRPKFAEGFYEVEAIRKKRICKGKPQYLIKWRGWPESANTWEPIDHLQTCPDVVEAFEESLRSEQKKSSRKRKRKFTQQKKKMQYSYGVSKSKVSSTKMTLSSEPQSSAALDWADVQSGMVEIVVEHDEGMKISSVAKLADCNGSETVSLQLGSNAKNHGALSSSKETGGKNIDVRAQQRMPVEGDGPANCQPRENHVEAGQDNQHRGAKRRKSGSVRRFTQEMTSFSLDYAKNSVPVQMSTCDRVEQLMLGYSDAYDKKKLDSSRSSAVITKLIKPISYSASVTNNIQDVSVTFVAMRSDGKEIMVDNKFLKANNPHLLINFYEQHLRYNPTN